MSNVYLASFLAALVIVAAPGTATRLTRRLEYPPVIRFCFFLILQQTVFALTAAGVGTYSLAFPVGASLTVLCGFLAGRSGTPVPAPNWRTTIVPWLVFSLVFLLYLGARSQYAYLNFNNNGNEVGIEKLFNLSLHQSFLFGSSYPPEWIWLSGEKIHYYVFLKSIPGLAAWCARVLFSQAATGGVFFIVSEAFFAALAPAVLCGWIQYFGRGCAHKSVPLALGVLLGLFSFFGTHFQALRLGISALFGHAPFSWWMLADQVVPHTDNQYPVLYLIMGDNHAYMQVLFLQALFWGAFLALAMKEKRDDSLAFATGILVAALCLSHPGSVLVDVVVEGFFVLLLTIYFLCNGLFTRLRAFIHNGAVVLLCSLTVLSVLWTPAGKIKTVWIDAALSSPLINFLNLNTSALLWIVLLFLYPLAGSVLIRTAKPLSGSNRGTLIGYAVVAAILIVVGRPALGVMTMGMGLAHVILFKRATTDDQGVLAWFAVSSFTIWLLPEIVAFDHVMDIRVEWIRFQMGLRFWPEGYLLIPFAMTVAAVDVIGQRQLSRAWVGGAALAIAIFTASHYPGIADRARRAPQTPSFDGFAGFAERYPGDGGIVDYLRNLPAASPVIIAEACGIGLEQVPVHFGWPGRIAAFSGRPGICGWARHAMLYNNPLEGRGFAGGAVEEKTRVFLDSYAGFFASAAAGNAESARFHLLTLRALGVSHIVFGSFEKALFPGFSVSRTVEGLPLHVAFETHDGMGVLQIDG